VTVNDVLDGQVAMSGPNAKAGIGFTELSNGFAACTDRQGLQDICDPLGLGTITVFFERWMSVLPVPLTDADREGRYWWELIFAGRPGAAGPGNAKRIAHHRHS
jgi:hypothetical protein